MSDILVEETYCLACEGKCRNDDPEDFDHLLVDFESFAGAWLDRGVRSPAIWAFLASVLVDIAMDNNMSEREAEEAFRQAWAIRRDAREED